MRIYFIAYLKKNSKSEELSTLHDLTHLFKNIRNIWIADKTRTLEFYDS